MPAPKVAVVIPARFGSTRFPGKPLFKIAGKPLIQHVWERCGKARGITAVIVATDDMRIAEAAFDFGAEVSMTSPKHRSGTDRCAEVAKRLAGFSHVINVQGDEPFVEPALIARLVKALTAEPKIDLITAAHAFSDPEDVVNPHAVKVVLDRESNALYFSRSAIPFVRGDGLAPAFYRHLGIYGYTVKALLRFVQWKPGRLEQAEQLEQLRALENGLRIRVLLTKTASLGIDTPQDAELAEKLLAAT